MSDSFDFGEQEEQLGDPPKSSPPPEIQENSIPSPPRKRSYDETDVNTSSVTLMGDSNPRDSQEPATDSHSKTETSFPSTAAHTMPPPPKAPSNTMMPPPRSGQGSVPSTQASQPQTPRKQPGRTEEPQEPTNNADAKRASSPVVPENPEAKIDDFQWNDLEERYHQKMNELQKSEQEIFDEFHHLMECFTVWASIPRDHEVDRSFKRLKTQATYVQHNESQLEEKRKHYITVVEAFRSAMSLLG